MRFKKLGLAEIYQIRKAVKDVCEQSGMRKEAVYGFVSAVDELCCNVMEHSKADWFEISADYGKGQVQAILRDNGISFDPARGIQQEETPHVFENALDRKIGLSMVGLMVDEVGHTRDASGVNQVVLKKKIQEKASI